MRFRFISKMGSASLQSRQSKKTGVLSVTPSGPLVRFRLPSHGPRSVISLMRICTMVPKASVTMAR